MEHWRWNSWNNRIVKRGMETNGGLCAVPIVSICNIGFKGRVWRELSSVALQAQNRPPTTGLLDHQATESKNDTPSQAKKPTQPSSQTTHPQLKSECVCQLHCPMEHWRFLAILWVYHTNRHLHFLKQMSAHDWADFRWFGETNSSVGLALCGALRDND